MPYFINWVNEGVNELMNESIAPGFKRIRTEHLFVADGWCDSVYQIIFYYILQQLN